MGEDGLWVGEGGRGSWKVDLDLGRWVWIQEGQQWIREVGLIEEARVKLEKKNWSLASELGVYFLHPPDLELILFFTVQNGTQLLGPLHFGFPGESL